MTNAEGPDQSVAAQGFSPDPAASRDVAGAAHAGSKNLALAAMLFAVAMTFIDQTFVAIASPSIQSELSLTQSGTQWVVNAYLLALAATFALGGRLADVIGSRRMVTIGIVGFAASSGLCGLTPKGSLAEAWIIFFRVLQGISAASSRVLVISIVRDCYSGRKMARVMSLAFIVFLAVPILAPSIGQAIMLVLPWRAIFVGLAAFGAIVFVWAGLRLPETLHAEDRVQTSVSSIAHAFRLTLSSRVAVGYMFAMTLMYGSLVGFINSAEQVFVDVFQAPRQFTTIFALIAVFMAFSSLLNSRIVGRFGTRVISHSAVIGYIAIACLHAMVALSGHETIWSFALLQSCMMFCFGLVGPNFGAMAMEPLGHVAGTASSVQGFVSTIGGALVGFYVGQHFDGTVVPLTLGFAGCSSAALLVVLVAEGGRLFRPTAAGIASAVDMAH